MLQITELRSEWGCSGIEPRCRPTLATDNLRHTDTHSSCPKLSWPLAYEQGGLAAIETQGRVIPFGHVDPTGAQTGGADRLYTAGDLAAAMALNPYLKVFSANGYYDAVTPFFQTVLNFENMPLSDPHARNNLTIHNYPSGHMVYLDNESRSSMRADLAAFYEGTRAYSPAVAARRAPQETGRISRSPYRRRFSRTPY